MEKLYSSNLLPSIALSAKKKYIQQCKITFYCALSLLQSSLNRFMGKTELFADFLCACTMKYTNKIVFRQTHVYTQQTSNAIKLFKFLLLYHGPVNVQVHFSLYFSSLSSNKNDRNIYFCFRVQLRQNKLKMDVKIHRQSMTKVTTK